MGKKFIVVEEASSGHNPTQVLDACMDIAAGTFGMIEASSKAILAKRGRKVQPTLEESIRTGRKPDVGF